MNVCCLRYERFGHEQCRVPTPTATIPSGKGETHEKRGRLRVDLGVVVVSSLTRSLVARRASVSAVCHVDTACTVFVAVFVVRRASIRRCGGGSYVVCTSDIDFLLLLASASVDAIDVSSLSSSLSCGVRRSFLSILLSHSPSITNTTTTTTTIVCTERVRCSSGATTTSDDERRMTTKRKFSSIVDARRRS